MRLARRFPQTPLGRPWWSLAATAALLAAFALLLFNLNMRKSLSHDENLFVAAGALARDGFLPYRAYPYNHTPYLAFVYAALFARAPDLLLAARAFSTACEVGLLIVVFQFAFALFVDRPHRLRFFVASAAALLLFSNPLFIYTSGYAWNHALPALAAVGAFLLQRLGTRAGRPGLVFASALCLGVAVGTRVSFVMAVPPLGAWILCAAPDSPRTRARLVAWWLAGLTAALLPAAVLWALAPSRFAFDVAGFHLLSAQVMRDRGNLAALTPFGKLVYFLKDVASAPGNLVLGFATSLAVWSLRRPGGSDAGRDAAQDVPAAITVALFLLAGAFASTPPWYQYFYAAVPFLVLAVLFATASAGRHGETAGRALRLFVLVVLVSCIYGLPAYAHLGGLRSVAAWVPVRVHRLGLEVRRLLGPGYVLTLAPLVPLEGGDEIYCPLTEGPFMWRAGHLLAPDARRRLDVVSPDDLPSLLAPRPPEGVLVGFEAAYGEGDLDAPLVAYAETHHYRPVRLRGGVVLWRSPGRPAAAVRRSSDGAQECGPG